MSTEKQAFRLVDQTGKFGKDLKLWTLIFDTPGEKVNKFSLAVMQDLEALIPKLEEMGKQGKIDALVMVSGKPGNFIAGADINMIQAARTAQEAEALSRMGQKLLDRYEDLPFPTVVAVNGTALGGGCELSLASSAIVMSNDKAAKIGLPEVMLGVIPGIGGCIRLPRKVGLATSLEMILTGKQLNGERAAKAGLAEACLPKENFEESVHRWTATNLKALRAGTRLAKEPKLGGMGGVAGTLMEKTPIGRSVIFKKARDGVVSKTKGHYPAPLEALSVIQETGGSYGERVRGTERDEAMAREARGFGKCAATEVSKHLIRIFFMTEALKKSKGIPADRAVALKPVTHTAVLGAGVMGGGIAQLLADKGLPARMKDLNSTALALGMSSAGKIFQSQVKKRRINQRQFLQKMNLIAPTTDFSGFGSADVVIEAIIEKMDVKQKVFRELENHVRADAVIVSNTSSLSISEMQKVMKKPERFAGMHFFNPVHKMPLVEVIRGAQSGDEAVATTYQLSKQLGKTPIVVKDSPGFLVNRLLAPYLNEATWMLADGVPIPELDQALLDFGLPMGPMELIDEVGVDVGVKVAHILHEAFGERMTPAPFTPKVASSGRLGKKNGKGIYEYEDKGRKKIFNEEIYGILGVTPKPGAVATEEIVERCILPMINEAARCLDEKVVETADEVDLGMIFGTGFPPFRGGLLRYADQLGARTVVDRLRRYEKRFGKRYEPAPSLVAMAENGKKFHSS